ncbi:MAG: tetratricopeptide repeat protein, partial [Caldilineaceae bacterium]|nr:tetratricopeptide repeat protein [Caldilineaceae bacterium]
DDQPLAAKVLDRMAQGYSTQLQYDQALQTYARTLTIWQAQADKRQVATTLFKMGAIYREAEQYDESLQKFQEALGLAQEIADRDLEARLWDRIAGAYRADGAFDKALTAYSSALGLWQELGDADNVARTQTNVSRTIQARFDRSLETRTENGVALPLDGEVVSGVISIKGIANHPQFQKWQLDLLLFGNETQATFIGVSAKAKPQVGTFITLDTTRYPNGTHKLRLRVVRDGANYDEYFTTITIQN